MKNTIYTHFLINNNKMGGGCHLLYILITTFAVITSNWGTGKIQK